jgi:deazaflavin-dependent oxidoreductase (nitroreductase family)
MTQYNAAETIQGAQMAKTYNLNFGRKLANALAAASIRFGLGDKRFYQLTVRGRKSGRPISTPVIVQSFGGKRWIVSPYGQRSWTKNARASGQVSLRRGGKSEAATLVEVDAATAAPVLKDYLRTTPITKGYFDVTPDSSLDAFAAEAPRHPVFLVDSSA